MKDLGNFSSFKDLDTVLEDEANKDTENKLYYVFVARNGKENKILYTTELWRAKLFATAFAKEIVYSTVWENENAN